MKSLGTALLFFLLIGFSSCKDDEPVVEPDPSFNAPCQGVFQKDAYNATIKKIDIVMSYNEGSNSFTGTITNQVGRNVQDISLAVYKSKGDTLPFTNIPLLLDGQTSNLYALDHDSVFVSYCLGLDYQ